MRRLLKHADACFVQETHGDSATLPGALGRFASTHSAWANPRPNPTASGTAILMHHELLRAAHTTHHLGTGQSTCVSSQFPYWPAHDIDQRA